MSTSIVMQLADLADKEVMNASDVIRFPDLLKQIPKSLRSQITEATAAMANREQHRRTQLMRARLTPSSIRLWGWQDINFEVCLIALELEDVQTEEQSVLLYWWKQGAKKQGIEFIFQIFCFLDPQTEIWVRNRSRVKSNLLSYE